MFPVIVIFLLLKTLTIFNFFSDEDERHGQRYNPNPRREEGPRSGSGPGWFQPGPEIRTQSSTRPEMVWPMFDPYIFFNFFSNLAHGCLLSGSILITLGILFCLPHSIVAVGAFLAVAKLMGLKFGPILFGAASFGILMSLPSPILVLLSTWIIFKMVFRNRRIFICYRTRRC